MRTVLRWTARILAVLMAAVAGLMAYVYVATNRLMAREYDVKVPAVSVPTDAAAIDRGKYIATRVSMCTACHEDDLGGKVVEDSLAMGRLVGTNLTRGRGGVGERSTNDDVVRALVHGVRSDRRSVIFMPSADFRFSESDLGALIAYIRSVPPVDRELPPSSIGPVARALTVLAGFPLTPAAVIDHDRVTLAGEKDLADPIAAGEKLVAMGGCHGCHLPTLAGGGGPPPGASNITPVGIGTWTREQFVTAIRDHKRPNGSTISDAMPREYGRMSDVDLHNIYAYLKTVPPAGTKLPRQ